AGKPRPDQATIDTVASWLEAEIDRAAALRPNPGRTETFHRINRAEYRNVIRDLLGLEVDVTSLLPADDATFGLDNIANTLSVTPALMERYMSAARRISRLAVGLAPLGPTIETYRASGRMSIDGALTDGDDDGQVSDQLPLGSRGGLVVHHYFPV